MRVRVRLHFLLALATSLPILIDYSPARSDEFQPSRVLAGETSLDQKPFDEFGASVVNAGDVNGDGYEDLLVGAPYRDSVGLDAGCVYLFLGGPNGVTGPVKRFFPTPSTTSPRFGLVIGRGGDFNGDGFADIFIGSPYEPQPDRSGRAYVYFGGKVIHDQPDLVLAGTEEDVFGAALSWVGDVNGDGYGDLVVGAPGIRPYSAGNTAGRASVFFGGPSPDSVPDLILESPLPSQSPFNRNFFGNTVACAGDVNGDGYSDFVVLQGVYGAGVGGRIWLYLGGPEFSGSPAAGLESGYAATWVASPSQMAAAAGDFNHDGIEDLIVRATPPEPPNYQGVYVYYGRHDWSGTNTPDLTLRATGEFDNLGSTIAGGSDLNGDGIDDLALGAYFSYVDGHVLGHVYACFGSSNPDLVPDVVIPGMAGSDETPGQGFGRSVATVDFNGDGVSELVVGAPFANRAIQASGLVYVYELAPPLLARAFLIEGHRTIPLTQAQARVCIEFEPIDGSFALDQVDMASLKLSVASGLIISAIPSKAVSPNDVDRDGVPDLGAYFAWSDFAKLFAGSPGRRTVNAALDGSLVGGRQFRAPLTLTVVGLPGNGSPASVSPLNVSCNPCVGSVRFALTGGMGVRTIAIFDVRGRRIRQLETPTGENSLVWDGTDSRGQAVGGGVYFAKAERKDSPNAGRATRFVLIR